MASCIALALLLFCAPANAELPLFTYKNAQGTILKPEVEKHKLTVFHFWATWCVPCVAELPEVDALQKTYGDKGLTVIAISMDGNNVDKVQQFFADHHIENLTLYMDDQNSAFQAFKTRGLPTTIFVDSAGKEFSRVSGVVDWQDDGLHRFIATHLQ